MRQPYGLLIWHEFSPRTAAAVVLGEYEIIWTGFNDMGSKVSNGVYFYEIIQGESKFNGKILVID